MTLAWLSIITALSSINGWHTMGYDLRHTSRFPDSGEIREPQLKWQMDISAREYLITANLEAGKFDLDPRGQADIKTLSQDDRRKWDLAMPLLDILGDGQLIEPPNAPGARWGKFLPDVAGLQRLSWTTTWGNDAHFQMHSFENGLNEPRLIWDIPFGTMYSPMVIVLDIDNDGLQEVVLSTWHGVIAYDIIDGTEKYRCMYREGHARQYGFFGSYTDPSGHAYLVVIGDFAGHIGVLAVKDGELKSLWQHIFDPQSEQGIDRRFTINTIGPDPISDFDGDGKGEVLMNVFNENNDGRWHLIAYDLETGEHRLDMPDIYLHGHVGNILLAQHCKGRPVATNGEIRLYNWDKLIWRHPYARWSMNTLPGLPLTHITGATKGMEAPVTDHSLIFFTESKDFECLNALQIMENNETRILWKIKSFVILDAVAISDGKTLVKARMGHYANANIESEGVKLEIAGINSIVRGAPQPLVLHDAENKPVIAVAETLDGVSLWAVQQDKPIRLWQHPGRAMTTQVPQMLGLIAGDVDQDGLAELLYVKETMDGHSRLIAMGLDGKKRWHFDFPEFNGRPPVWNECGTTIWSLGHFVDPDRLDIMVSNRRSIMHSDETVVLRSDNRQIIWHKNILEVKPPWADTPWPHTRGYGGGVVAIADMDGDGTDDIVLCYPAEYSIVKGKTGEQYMVENTGPLKGTDGFWVFGGFPLVADLNGDGLLETLSVASGMVLAFSNRDGHAEIIWRTEPDDGASGFPAIGDTDGDDILEIGLPGFKDGFRCLEAATGKILWAIPSQGSPASNCIAVDINGDGLEEFVYANGPHLLAVAQRSDLESNIIWQITLPSSIQNIAISDVDGDGKIEILASGSNGVIYCIY